MGNKGDKLTKESAIATEEIINKLLAIKGISSKKMFGGHGMFYNEKMFGIIDSKGIVFLKADQSNQDEFIKLGGIQHSRMPYYSVPQTILEDDKKLIIWAKKSIEISK